MARRLTNFEDRPHIDQSYDDKLRTPWHLIVEMGGLVEKQVASAIGALERGNLELAQQTIARDHSVNRFDVEVDEVCIRLLALRHPTAGDLRLITTSIKITTDLERVGDLAVGICERVLEMSEEPKLEFLVDLAPTASVAERMLRESLDAFVRGDVELARKVCADDDEIDALNKTLFNESLTYMVEHPRAATRILRLLFVSKCLERIADHATNIAEMVVFMVKGSTIRHLAACP